MKEAKKRISRFWKGYFLTTTLLLLLTGAGLGIFYDFIRAYELSQPHNAAEKYVQSFEDKQLFSWIRSASESLPLHYETADTAAQGIINQISLTEGKYTWQREYGTASNVPVYRLYRGENPVGIFFLEEEGTGRYGFTFWKAAKGEAILSDISHGSVTKTICAPEGSQVQINGIPVREEDLVSVDTLYAYLHPLDKKDSVGVYRYVVQGLFAEPTVTCTWDEKSCIAETEGTSIYFRLPESSIQAYTVRIPKGAQLFVNGNPVSEEYRSKQNIPYEYSILEYGMQNLPTEEEYRIEGLHTKPVIAVQWEGLALSVTEVDSVFQAEYPKSQMYSCSICVPSDSSVFVRGVSCAELAAPVQKIAYPDLYSHEGNAPSYDLYRFDSLYLPLTDVSIQYKGENLPYSEQCDEKLQTIEALFPTCDQPDIRNLALSFAKDYVHYVAYGYSNTAVNLANVLTHVQKGSDLYLRIQRSKIGIDFVTPVSSQVYKQLEITEMRQISDTNIYCSIAFDIDQYVYKVHRSYKGTLELNCVRDAEQWSISEMRITSND